MSERGEDFDAMRRPRVGALAWLAAGALLAAVLALAGGAFALGLSFGRNTDTALARTRHWMNVLAAQCAELDDLRARMQARAQALAIQVGGVQADMIRLDALGQRLTAMAGLSRRTFDFAHAPGLFFAAQPLDFRGAATH